MQLSHGDRAGAWAWSAVALLLLLPALLVARDAAAPAVLDWQPARWPTDPWRAWTAAWVHLSALHLWANVAGGLLVAALGIAARMPPRAALAWSLAWPLTQIALLATPELTRYAGLSGVLHAGVAVVAATLLRRRRPAERRLGLAIGVVVVAKLLSETPWRGPLSHPAGWDIAVAPMAHVSGVVCGALLGWVLCRNRR